MVVIFMLKMIARRMPRFKAGVALPLELLRLRCKVFTAADGGAKLLRSAGCAVIATAMDQCAASVPVSFGGMCSVIIEILFR